MFGLGLFAAVSLEAGSHYTALTALGSAEISLPPLHLCHQDTFLKPLSSSGEQKGFPYEVAFRLGPKERRHSWWRGWSVGQNAVQDQKLAVPGSSKLGGGRQQEASLGRKMGH